jgi:ubiquinone/menaquinone biosynthesis C-methylase UbiE
MSAQTGNADQVAYWNGLHGKIWANEQEKRDRDHAPMTEAGIALAAPKPGERVLDIGCGSGTTTLKLAARVAPSGEAIGIDISGPMLAVARGRAAETRDRTRFIEADAADYPFEPESFDLAFSQFGIMFFADPAASFRNIHSAMKNGGRLVFVCWRHPFENP